MYRVRRRILHPHATKKRSSTESKHKNSLRGGQTPLVARSLVRLTTILPDERATMSQFWFFYQTYVNGGRVFFDIHRFKTERRKLFGQPCETLGFVCRSEWMASLFSFSPVALSTPASCSRKRNRFRSKCCYVVFFSCPSALKMLHRSIQHLTAAGGEGNADICIEKGKQHLSVLRKKLGVNHLITKEPGLQAGTSPGRIPWSTTRSCEAQKLRRCHHRNSIHCFLSRLLTHPRAFRSVEPFRHVTLAEKRDQVDVTGQVVSDSIGKRMYSGVGGQVRVADAIF